MKGKIHLPVIAVLSMVTIGSAYAAKTIENDALALETAKISLTQAVTAAEQQAGGKAARAEFEKYKGRWIYDIEVVAGKKVMDVKIDPVSGKLIAATEDMTDHDDGNDHAD